MILVVCALPAELRAFTPRAGVEILACGVGPVEAAAETARMLQRKRFGAVVNAGIAGAFRGRARIGDAVIVSDEQFADFGLEGGGAFTLPDGATLAERVPASPSLLERCAGLPYRLARGVTVSQVTATRVTADRLSARYDADVESMEGFAVLRAAQLAGVPAIELRGISNYVDDRANAECDFRAGAAALTQALEA
ncbi:MAG: futalosine hydrolase, partial [Candidatus Eremiobacteraeota bacterium]|nr:futalosine hydrolase [Candidatus Eremiobacteraeota bacterium]